MFKTALFSALLLSLLPAMSRAAGVPIQATADSMLVPPAGLSNVHIPAFGKRQFTLVVPSWSQPYIFVESADGSGLEGRFMVQDRSWAPGYTYRSAVLDGKRTTIGWNNTGTQLKEDRLLMTLEAGAKPMDVNLEYLPGVPEGAGPNGGHMDNGRPVNLKYIQSASTTLKTRAGALMGAGHPDQRSGRVGVRATPPRPGRSWTSRSRLPSMPGPRC